MGRNRKQRETAAIAIDLGGTKLASALFTERGNVSYKRVVALQGRTGRAVAALIQRELARLQSLARKKNLNVKAVGISVPGIAHAETGRVWAPNIPGWKNYPLKREIESFLRSSRRKEALIELRAPRSALRIRQSLLTTAAAPIVIESDRACSILGEAWQGAARGCQHAIFLAVGTGIGAGILVDGKVLRGARDIAGAIGWMALARPFRPEYIPCGCFEHHASGEGLVKIATKFLAQEGLPPSAARPSLFTGRQRSITPPLHHPNALTTRDLFPAYARNDPIAKKVLAEAIEFWGMAVANLVSLFNPEKIIFGGGVFGPAKQFLDDIYAEAKKWAQPVAMKRVKLQPSTLGSDAALYGAGHIAWLAAATCNSCPDNPTPPPSKRSIPSQNIMHVIEHVY